MLLVICVISYIVCASSYTNIIYVIINVLLPNFDSVSLLSLPTVCCWLSVIIYRFKLHYQMTIGRCVLDWNSEDILLLSISRTCSLCCRSSVLTTTFLKYCRSDTFCEH